VLAITARRRSRTHLVVISAIYATFLLTAQFEHHDLICHLKTPQHCTACTSSIVGSDPGTLTVADAFDRADAGGALTIDVLTDGFLLSVRSSGRSPPTVA